MTTPDTLIHGVRTANRVKLWIKLVVLFFGSAALMGALQGPLADLPDVELAGFAASVADVPGFDKIVTFELAGHPQGAEVVRSPVDGEPGGPWSDDRARVAAILLIDYVFIYAYALGLALVVSHTAEAMVGLPTWTIRGTARLAALPLLAGAADAVENAALLGVLAERNQWFVSELAEWSALTKFALLGVTLGAWLAVVVLAMGVALVRLRSTIGWYRALRAP